MLVSLCYVLLRWLFDSRLCALARRSSRNSNSSSCGTNSRSFGGQRVVRRSLPSTGCSSLLPAARCRACSGDPSLSRRRRCCAGIDAWSPSGGRTRVRSVIRRCGVRFERWCCGSRARTRGGLSTHCRRTEGAWHRGVRDDRPRVASGRGARPGGSAAGDDVARVRPGTSTAPVGRRLLSPSRRSGCNGSTCSSSLSWAAAVCAQPVARRTRARHGLSSRLASCRGRWRTAPNGFGF